MTQDNTEAEFKGHTSEGVVMRRRQDTREVAEGVEFARLMALSSFGEQDAIEDRLTGAEELAALYPPPDVKQTDPCALYVHNRDAEIDMQVAEELEWRGYTFEAELRYRRLLHEPGAAARLAMLLEAKGFRRKSWTMYLRAAAQRDVGSLLRLAVLCRQRGETGWARRLAATAGGVLGQDAMADLHEHAEHFRAARRSADGLHRIEAEPIGDTSAQTYALGSLLFVFADRPDLARVAYSSAIAQGHTLAAVSLLDLALPCSGRGSSYLDRALTRTHEHDGLIDEHPSRYPVPFDGADDLHTTVGIAAPLGDLLDAARCNMRRGPEQHDALDRLGQIAKVITRLRSYASTPCSTTTAALRAQHAAIQIGSETQHQAQDPEGPTSAALIRWAWQRSGEVLGSRHHAGFSTTDEHASPSNINCGPSAMDDGWSKATTGSGAVHRLHTELRRLPNDELCALAAKQSGLTINDTSEVIDQTAQHTTKLLQTAVAKLHAGQAGEQQHPAAHDLLWAEVKSALETV